MKPSGRGGVGNAVGVLDRLPTLLLVPHADAGDRTKWTSDQDLRPLSVVGREQAAALAAEVGARVDAIVSSPARRCVETVEPIAATSGVGISLSDDLRELTFVTEQEAWDPWGLDPEWRSQLLAGAAVGRALRVLDSLAAAHDPSSRVVVSAHGDLVPLLGFVFAGFFREPRLPAVARGGCYEIDVRSSEPIKALGAVQPRP